MTFGEKLRERRLARGFSMGTLSVRAGMTRGAISKLEAGERQPSLYTAVALARALDCDVSELYGPELGPPSTVISSRAVELPVYSFIHAGPEVLWQAIPDRTVAVSEARVGFGAALTAVEVVGDCMDPDVKAGDVVVFDRNRRDPQNGDMVVLTIPGDGLHVRWAWRLRSGRLVLGSNVPNDVMNPEGMTLEGVVVSVIPALPRRPRPDWLQDED